MMLEFDIIIDGEITDEQVAALSTIGADCVPGSRNGIHFVSFISIDVAIAKRTVESVGLRVSRIELLTDLGELP